MPQSQLRYWGIIGPILIIGADYVAAHPHYNGHGGYTNSGTDSGHNATNDASYNTGARDHCERLPRA